MVGPKYKTAEYKVWSRIIQRCTNPNATGWCRYGGAGIRICDEWRHDFDAFLAHVGPRPSDKHSIDRINNERGYEPGNIRWATIQEQNRNRRQGLITVGGITRHKWEWAEITGIDADAIGWRISKGMPPERAISRPIGRWNKKQDGGGLTPEQRRANGLKLQGENNPSARLTEARVARILAMRDRGASGRNIAKQLKLAKSTVFDVLSRKNWKHVTAIEKGETDVE